MSAALAVFVKTPGHSSIKTRLAAGIGQTSAERWYRQSAQATLAVVEEFANAAQGSAYWAVAEAAALSDPAWADLPCIAQPQGGLGARMAAIYSQLQQAHGAVMLIGADAPQLQTSELIRAAQWLSDIERARFAIGPALDGGFWLFGGNRPLPDDVWTQVSYSQSDTAAQFRRAVGEHAPWLELTALRDVDDVDDLPAVAAALESLTDPLPAQRELAVLSRSLLAERSARA